MKYNIYYPPVTIRGTCISVQTSLGEHYARERARKLWWQQFSAPEPVFIETGAEPPATPNLPIDNALRAGPGGIAELELSVRSWNALVNAGVTLISEIRGLDSYGLMAIPGIGWACASDISHAIFEHDNPQAASIDTRQNAHSALQDASGATDGQVAVSEDPSTGEIVYKTWGRGMGI